MSEYAADIRKYTPNVSEKAIEKIVKYCGIALRNLDARYVSLTDAAEVKRVVDGFCSKKLGLDSQSAETAVRAVGDRMKADRHKHRVTVYYLVAEQTDTLGRLV
jgi:hypothetical protein